MSVRFKKTNLVHWICLAYLCLLRNSFLLFYFIFSFLPKKKRNKRNSPQMKNLAWSFALWMDWLILTRLSFAPFVDKPPTWLALNKISASVSSWDWLRLSSCHRSFRLKARLVKTLWWIRTLIPPSAGGVPTKGWSNNGCRIVIRLSWFLGYFSHLQRSPWDKEKVTIKLFTRTYSYSLNRTNIDSILLNN